MHFYVKQTVRTAAYKLASGAYLGETVSLTHSTDLEKYIIPVRPDLKISLDCCVYLSTAVMSSTDSQASEEEQWIVAKFGGTSLGKFMENIAEQIVP